MALTNAEIITTIKVSLGWSSDETKGVSVELTTDQMTNAITQALRFYNRFCPLVRRAVLPLTAGIDQYSVIATVVTGDVIEVFPSNPSGSNFDDVFSMNRLDGTMRNAGAGSYLVALKDFQTVQDIYNAEFDWEFERDPIAGTAYLYITNHSNIIQASYLYTSPHTVTTIPVADETWFIPYVQSLSELILAKMRGKYSEIPGQQSTVNLGADTLKSDAQTAKDTLEDELKNRGKAVLIMQG